MKPQNRLTVEKREAAYPLPAGSPGEHSHNAHEMLYVLDGAAEVTVGGSQYTAEGGSVVLLSRLESHCIRPLTDSYSRYVLIVPPEAVRTAPGGERLGSIFVNRPAGFSHCLHLGEHRQLLDPLFDGFYKEAKGAQAFTDERLICLLGELLITLYRLQPTAFSVPMGRADETVCRVKAYIDEHYAEPIAVGELASLFYLSNCHLSHIFRRVTGYTLKQYLLLCRLAEARTLLYHTNESIGSIALQVGFADVNNFIRYFRQQIGLTPSQYRKQQRRLPASDETA